MHTSLILKSQLFPCELPWETSFGKAESTSDFPDCSKGQSLPTHSTGTAHNCCCPHTWAPHFRKGKSCEIYPKISRIGQKASEPIEVPHFQREMRWWWISFSCNISAFFLTCLRILLGRKPNHQLPARATGHTDHPQPHYWWQLKSLICSLEVSAQKDFNAAFHAGHLLKEANTV